MIPKIDQGVFDWHRWRAGSPADLFLICRTAQLIKNRETLRHHAVGWCSGEQLLCRPKSNHKAVMFYKEGQHFWFHLTNNEFKEIFHEA